MDRTRCAAAVIAAAASIGMLLGCSSHPSADPGVGAGPGDSGAVDSSVFPGDASDSGSVDSAPVDAGSLDSGLPPEDCTGLAYCDDFESYGDDAGLDDAGLIKNGAMLGPWKASVGSTATMTVDTVRAYTGHKALHVKISPSTSSTGGTLSQTAPAGLIPGDAMFGRAMFYFAPPADDAGNGLPSKVHSFFFRTTGKYVPEDASVVMDVGDSETVLFLNYFPPLHFEENVAGGDVAPSAWHCLQWQFDGSANPPVIHSQVFMDQQPVVNVPEDAGWVFATPWTVLDFGFAMLNPETNGIDVSLDTFALDSKPIACP